MNARARRPGQRVRVVGAAVLVLLLVGSSLLVSRAPLPTDGAPGSHATPLAAPRLAPRPVNGSGNGSGGAGPPWNGTLGGSASPSSPGWYDLTGWTASAPAIRTFTGLADDPPLRGVLLFGGYNPIVAAYGDTWLWSNSTWTDLTGNLTAAPPARWGAVMVWDPADQYVVLFGGRDPSTFYNDTWVYNATGWHNVTTSVAPAPRAFSVAFYDPALSRIVLLDGGCLLCNPSSSWFSYNDTWEFGAGRWTNVTASLSSQPPTVVQAYAGWDPASGSAVYYGGAVRPGGCANYNATWNFSGNWSAAQPSTNPGNFSGGASTWDAVDGYLLMFSGVIPTPNNPANGYCNPPDATWSYAGGQWVNRTSTLSNNTPNGRCCATMVYDSTDRVVLMFGGNNYIGYYGTYLNETWTFPVPPLSAEIAANRSFVPANSSVDLAAWVRGGMRPFTFSWSFGDGSPNSTAAQVNHTFGAPGDYVVTLRVVDAQNRSVNLTRTLRVITPLAATLSEAPTLGEAPLKVSFNVSLSGGAAPYRFAWTFGDGGTATAGNVTYTYRTAGNFTAVLAVTDAANATVRLSAAITVLGPLTASLSATPPLGVAPLTVHLSAAPGGGDPPFGYLWEFGDGSQALGNASVSHVFGAAGQYVVNLTVTDALGFAARASRTLTVDPPLAGTIRAAPAGVAPLTETFDENVTGGVPPVMYDWALGDGTTATGPSVLEVFASPGTYLVRLTATDAVGDTARANYSVEVIAPLAAAPTATPAEATEPAHASFVAGTTGGLLPFTYSWSFGDGATSAAAAPTHTYTLPGTYTVTLLVTDALGEVARGSAHVTVLLPLLASLSASPANVTVGAVLALRALASGGAGPFDFAWSDLPPGCPAQDAADLTCAPTATGAFDIAVNITDRTTGSSATGSAFVSVESLPTASPGPGNTSGGGSVPTAAWIVVVAAVAVGGIGAGVLIARRRGAGPPPPVEETYPSTDPPVDEPPP